jgi:hypothetical protein
MRGGSGTSDTTNSQPIVGEEVDGEEEGEDDDLEVEAKMSVGDSSYQ